MSTIIIITPPPPPPPPPEKMAGDLNAWYWAEGHKAGQLAVRAESPMVKAKRWFKSRTIRFNAFAGVVLTTLVAYSGDVKEALGEYGAIGVVVLMVGNAAYRFVTDSKVTK